MDIRGIDTPLLDWSGDAIALGLFEDETILTGELSQLDEKTGEHPVAVLLLVLVGVVPSVN